ncbi:uncharacterized protein LOC144065828 [Stigmatopora argus]
MSDPAVGFHPRRRPLVSSCPPEGAAAQGDKQNSPGLIALQRLIQVKMPFWRPALTRPNCCTFAVQMQPTCSIQEQVYTSQHAKVATLCSGATPTGWKNNFKSSYFGLNI